MVGTTGIPMSYIHMYILQVCAAYTYVHIAHTYIIHTAYNYIIKYIHTYIHTMIQYIQYVTKQMHMHDDISG